MRIKLIVTAILLMLPVTVRAAVSCHQLKAAFIEGSARYDVTPPQFRLQQVNSADENKQFFSITMFDDARAMIICSSGMVETFAADANRDTRKSINHAMLLADFALHGFGLELRQAHEMRDQLVNLAKASDRRMSEVHIEGGKASLVISVAGVPSFEIDTDR
jgi:hypothetical protein